MGLGGRFNCSHSLATKVYGFSGNFHCFGKFRKLSIVELAHSFCKKIKIFCSMNQSYFIIFFFFLAKARCSQQSIGFLLTLICLLEWAKHHAFPLRRRARQFNLGPVYFSGCLISDLYRIKRRSKSLTTVCAGLREISKYLRKWQGQKTLPVRYHFNI